MQVIERTWLLLDAACLHTVHGSVQCSKKAIEALLHGDEETAKRKTAKEMGGDPGFLVNGPPLKEAGRLMRLKNGAIADIPIPRPAYVPPPAYVRPAEPKMNPMQLAQHQMTLPLG